MHLERADLHFERLVFRPDHRGVQRAVVVGLGLRDVVVELARKRRPHVMDDAERRVAILDVVDENAHRANVVERVDAGLLAAHLVPDAVDVLGPTRDLGADPRGGELALQAADDLLDVALRGRAGARRAASRSSCRFRARARAATGPRAPISAARCRGGSRAARTIRAPRAPPAGAARSSPRRPPSGSAAPRCARRASRARRGCPRPSRAASCAAARPAPRVRRRRPAARSRGSRPSAPRRRRVSRRRRRSARRPPPRRTRRRSAARPAMRRAPSRHRASGRRGSSPRASPRPMSGSPSRPVSSPQRSRA